MGWLPLNLLFQQNRPVVAFHERLHSAKENIVTDSY